MDSDLVRKAFLEVLEREVDEGALNFYTQKGIGYDKLCEVLKSSKEYAGKFEGGGEKKKARVRHNNSFVDLPFPQLFVAKNIKVLYCPIAKNACSSLKSLMVELSDIPDSYKEMVRKGDVHLVTDEYNTGVQLKDLDEAEARDAMDSDGYFRFIVLRDPAARLVSTYWEKFVVNRSHEGNLIHTLPVIRDVYKKEYGELPDSDRGITFRQFIEYIKRTSEDDLDPHWKHQYKYAEGVKISCYYDQKNLSPLYSRLSELCGKQIEEKRKNVSGSGSGIYVKGAEDMFPSALMSYKGVDAKSFITGYIKKEIEECYCKDYHLMSKCAR